MSDYKPFPTPRGFLVLHRGSVTAGPFDTRGEALAWIDGRRDIEGKPLGAAGAILAAGILIAAAVAFAGLAFAIGANLPAIGGGLIICAIAAFLMGR